MNGLSRLAAAVTGGAVAVGFGVGWAAGNTPITQTDQYKTLADVIVTRMEVSGAPTGNPQDLDEWAESLDTRQRDVLALLAENDVREPTANAEFAELWDESFSDGFASRTWTAGANVEPGRYVSSERSDGACTWKLVRGGGEYEVTVVASHGTVTLRPGDVFTSTGCGRWVRVVE